MVLFGIVLALYHRLSLFASIMIGVVSNVVTHLGLGAVHWYRSKHRD